MCQRHCCGCLWCNCFKICCMGLGCNLFCCSAWCCKPEELQSFDYNCLTCCEKTGFGGASCLGLGVILCAPPWLLKYSDKKNQPRKNDYDP